MKGRKRHILVDTEGFVLKAKVHSTKVMDYEGIKMLLHRAQQRFPRLHHLRLEAGYRGEEKGKDWALRRPRALERGSSGASEKGRSRRGA